MTAGTNKRKIKNILDFNKLSREEPKYGVNYPKNRAINPVTALPMPVVKNKVRVSSQINEDAPTRPTTERSNKIKFNRNARAQHQTTIGNKGLDSYKGDRMIHIFDKVSAGQM